MTKFKIGDRVQYILDSELITGTVRDYERNGNCLVVGDGDEGGYSYDDLELAPAPALVVVPGIVGWVIDAYQKEKNYPEIGAYERGRTLYEFMGHLRRDTGYKTSEVRSWAMQDDANMRLLARAWLDGYTVEKEPLYYVRLPHFGYITNRMDYTLSQSKDDAVALTESKIKGIDKGYWQFAVPIEEDAD